MKQGYEVITFFGAILLFVLASILMMFAVESRDIEFIFISILVYLSALVALDTSQRIGSEQ